MKQEPLDRSFEEGPEALTWLKNNGHEAALASNRFDSTAHAIEFVKCLYMAGARHVFVPSESIRDDEEELSLGGAYSDTLIIELADGKVPPKLLDLYCKEATVEGYDLSKEPPPVIEGRFMLLWWD